MYFCTKSKVSAACLALALSGALTTGVQAEDWSGGYGGITLGAGPVDFTSALGSDGDMYNSTGKSIGGLLGYNAQEGKLIFGVEAEYGSVSGADYNLVGSDGFNSNLHQNELTAAGFLRARIGFEVTETTMVYSSVGMAFLQGTITSSDSDYYGTYNANAFELGMGIEKMVMENLSVRGSAYLLTNAVTDAPVSEQDFMSMNRISLAVSYHF